MSILEQGSAEIVASDSQEAINETLPTSLEYGSPEMAARVEALYRNRIERMGGALVGGSEQMRIEFPPRAQTVEL